MSNILQAIDANNPKQTVGRQMKPTQIDTTRTSPSGLALVASVSNIMLC
jgi:hypothetical protein